MAVTLLEPGPLDKVARLRVAVAQSLVQRRRALELAVAHLELDVGVPGLLVGLPRHPALKDLPASRDVAEEFLEVDVLVPDLVDARQERHAAVVQVAGVLHVASLELHLDVREPELERRAFDVERALKHAPCPVAV